MKKDFNYYENLSKTLSPVETFTEDEYLAHVYKTFSFDMVIFFSKGFSKNPSLRWICIGKIFQNEENLIWNFKMGSNLSFQFHSQESASFLQKDIEKFFFFGKEITSVEFDKFKLKEKIEHL